MLRQLEGVPQVRGGEGIADNKGDRNGFGYLLGSPVFTASPLRDVMLGPYLCLDGSFSGR